SALILREKLVTDHPKVVAYRHGVAQTRLNVATLHQQTGRLAEAEFGFRAAVAALEKLAADSPKEPAYLPHLPPRYHRPALCFKQTGQTAEFETMANKAKATKAALDKLEKKSQ